jgi:zinc transport system substrate-binding protein
MRKSKFRNLFIESFEKEPDALWEIISNPHIYNELINMDSEYTLKSQNTQNRKFMIFFFSLTYLARDYDLEQIPIEFEGKEPSPVRLAEIIKRSKNEKINIIFIQAEYDINNAKQIAAETGATLVKINPMDYDWMKTMTEIKEYF